MNVNTFPTEHLFVIEIFTQFSKLRLFYFPRRQSLVPCFPGTSHESGTFLTLGGRLSPTSHHRRRQAARPFPCWFSISQWAERGLEPAFPGQPSMTGPLSPEASKITHRLQAVHVHIKAQNLYIHRSRHFSRTSHVGWEPEPTAGPGVSTATAFQGNTEQLKI